MFYTITFTRNASQDYSLRTAADYLPEQLKHDIAITDIDGVEIARVKTAFTNLTVLHKFLVQNKIYNNAYTTLRSKINTAALTIIEFDYHPDESKGLSLPTFKVSIMKYARKAY